MPSKSNLTRAARFGGRRAASERRPVMTTQLYATKNDLSEETRRSMVALLNRQLADAIDLGLQAKQAHWNVKGPHFVGLHDLFDKVYEQAGDYADDVAERAVELGGVALGTIHAVGAASRIPTYPLDIASGREHVDALSSAVATLARSTRASRSEGRRGGDEE